MTSLPEEKCKVGLWYHLIILLSSKGHWKVDDKMSGCQGQPFILRQETRQEGRQDDSMTVSPE